MFVKIIYRHFVFNQEKYQVCKFRIYRHFVKSVNGSNFPVISKSDFQSKDREHEWCKDPYIFGCKPYESLRSTSSKLCFKLRQQVRRKQTWLADEKKKASHHRTREIFIRQAMVF